MSESILKSGSRKLLGFKDQCGRRIGFRRLRDHRAFTAHGLRALLYGLEVRRMGSTSRSSIGSFNTESREDGETDSFRHRKFREPVASRNTLGVLWNYKKRKEHINVVFPGFKRNNLANFLQALAFGLCSITH